MRDQDPEISYQTSLGAAWHGEAEETLQNEMEDESVDLIVTSPPFALQRPKAYGNETQENYVAWFSPLADEFWRILKPTGSLVVDLGGAWVEGQPVKSIYAFELLVHLCRRPRAQFVLAQDFYWYNPSRLPTPASWVTIERLRAKDAVNTIWWLSKTTRPKSDNRRVLKEYSDGMKKLVNTGKYNRGKRPSGHIIKEGFTNDLGGAIPPNILIVPNTSSDDKYLRECKRRNLEVHPARFPREIPEFFIRMLTDEGDLVVDPFAGSNVTGRTAEDLERRWLSVDLNERYVESSVTRFSEDEITLVGAKK